MEGVYNFKLIISNYHFWIILGNCHDVVGTGIIHLKDGSAFKLSLIFKHLL